jgi:hypothetical protein
MTTTLFDVSPGNTHSYAASSLLPTSPSFAGHQTFAVRSGWLKKGVDALIDDGAIFNQPDALVTLGVGKNMVTAIRHWLLVMGVAHVEGRELRATPLGKKIFGSPDVGLGFDPYLEDPATLWIFHWNLCGPGSSAFTWAWAFNYFREYEWTRDALTDAVMDAAKSRVTKPPSRETVERDVSTLVQTYAADERGQNAEDPLDCPLRGLGLVRPGFERHFRFEIGPKSSLPLPIFTWALGRFWNWKYPHAQTVSVRDIAHAEGSPGMIFKLDEDSVLEYLDDLADITGGTLRFEDTPLVRQVVLNGQGLAFDALLETHYV